MSLFTANEQEYLSAQQLGRLATVSAQGDPHVVPVAFRYNVDEDSIDIGGFRIATTAKWRHAERHPRVSFVVDDVQPPFNPRFLMIQADVELLPTGGETLGDGFKPEMMRLRPVKVSRYGIDQP